MSINPDAEPYDVEPDYDVESDDEAVAYYYHNVLMAPPPPCTGIRTKNNSVLQGSTWCAEILRTTNEDRWYNNVRMSRDSFYGLVEVLESKGYIWEDCRTKVGVVESVLIFIRTVCMHHHMRDEEERFQHSTETVFQHFHRVRDGLVKLAPTVICKPDYTCIPKLIQDDYRMYPYFEGAVGAIDGTLIPAFVPAAEATAYRSRKGQLAQNVLAIIDFNMLFTYVYAGWEGSAHDAKVLMDAIEKDPDGFPWPPEGRYYLCDAGYTNYAAFLAPYRAVRYNLPEFNNANITAANQKKLFNHRHSQLQNVVERTFGVLKSQFPLLAHGMPCYKIDNQPPIVIACCALHNWIRLSGFDDDLFEGGAEHYAADTLIFSAREFPSQPRIVEQGHVRDDIANALWENYGGH